mmetsp:Transcript_40063/g.63350  ORF Transcript_40063/g.63350 Transcript_40063/m.63350 type:complete len:406 (+) Transcript_40063:138-1355(+)
MPRNLFIIKQQPLLLIPMRPSHPGSVMTPLSRISLMCDDRSQLVLSSVIIELGEGRFWLLWLFFQEPELNLFHLLEIIPLKLELRLQVIVAKIKKIEKLWELDGLHHLCSVSRLLSYSGLPIEADHLDSDEFGETKDGLFLLENCIAPKGLLVFGNVLFQARTKAVEQEGGVLLDMARQFKEALDSRYGGALLCLCALVVDTHLDTQKLVDERFLKVTISSKTTVQHSQQTRKALLCILLLRNGGLFAGLPKIREEVVQLLNQNSREHGNSIVGVDLLEHLSDLSGKKSIRRSIRLWGRVFFDHGLFQLRYVAEGMDNRVHVTSIAQILQTGGEDNPLGLVLHDSVGGELLFSKNWLLWERISRASQHNCHFVFESNSLPGILQFFTSNQHFLAIRGDVCESEEL